MAFDRARDPCRTPRVTIQWKRARGTRRAPAPARAFLSYSSSRPSTSMSSGISRWRRNRPRSATAEQREGANLAWSAKGASQREAERVKGFHLDGARLVHYRYFYDHFCLENIFIIRCYSWLEQSYSCGHAAQRRAARPFVDQSGSSVWRVHRVMYPESESESIRHPWLARASALALSSRSTFTM